MSEHSWCRDLARDEAVRAAEDAAAVPAIQHRDLPEQVALLWASLGDILGRVVRLEGEMDAGDAEEAASAAQPEPRVWLTAEEREAVERCRRHFVQKQIDFLQPNDPGDRWLGGLEVWRRAEATLVSLLARSSPPRVKVPPKHASWWELLHARDGQWRDAIREAGGEVEE